MQRATAIPFAIATALVLAGCEISTGPSKEQLCYQAGLAVVHSLEKSFAADQPMKGHWIDVNQAALRWNDSVCPAPFGKNPSK